jgi:hypothetical protein
MNRSVMKRLILQMVASYLRKISAWNAAFCSLAICVVITTHAALMPGHMPPLITPKQQETSTTAAVKQDDPP